MYLCKISFKNIQRKEVPYALFLRIHKTTFSTRQGKKGLGLGFLIFGGSFFDYLKNGNIFSGVSINDPQK